MGNGVIISACRWNGTDWGNLGRQPIPFSYILPTPALSDSGLYQHTLSLTAPATLYSVSCTTDTGVATVNLDVRLAGSSSLPGTPVMTAPLQCGPYGAIAAVLDSPAVPPDASVALLVSGVAGAPSVVRVYVSGYFDQ